MLRMNRRKQGILALVLVFVLLFSTLVFAAYEPFKVELTLFERIVMMGLLPIEENFITLKIVRELKIELGATEKEYKLADFFKLPSGGMDARSWDAVPKKEIILGDIAKGLIKEALIELDKTKRLTEQHFTLYEKIVLEIEDEVIKEGE